MKKIFKFAYELLKKAVSPRYRFQIALFALALIAGSILLVYFSKPDSIFYNELSDKDKPFYLRNIAVVLAALATAIFTWWKNTVATKTTEIQEDTRLDALFAKAVEYLEREKSLNTRKGGVYILKDLAMTSPKHAQKCIDMLCALNETWMPKFLNDYPDFFIVNKNFPNIKNIEKLKLNKDSNDDANYLCKNETAKEFRNDVALSQVVLQTLSEVIKHVGTNGDYTQFYYLEFSFLCAMNLRNMELKKFICNYANFQSTSFGESILNSPSYWGTSFKNAYLYKANFSGTYIREAEFRSAELAESTFRKASFLNSSFIAASLQEANFSNTIILSTSFESANLNNVDFRNATIFGVNFSSANAIKTNFKSANIANCNFSNTNIQQADFRNTNIKRGDIKEAINWEDAIYDGD